MLLLSDKGGAVLSSVVEYYLDSSSSQALLLLSSIREPHHKVSLACSQISCSLHSLCDSNTCWPRPLGAAGEAQRVCESIRDQAGRPHPAGSPDQETAAMGSSHQPLAAAALTAALPQGNTHTHLRHTCPPAHSDSVMMSIT